ncbi:WcbI family polysaccharide biosynthesis putative acetyltransferase [Limnohabitans sp. Jir61]|uniref:WcbI family polysaccharide biosynthesis putative acetyltransferase n=1 Tax=Limnohabitans sp. Jir61 TaxID=1826168 RepID=UPI0011B28E0C|nr:WcbI family polysaccharide biosynthesis putative acetyltransferase [Limnohabitans sp. Jir61]
MKKSCLLIANCFVSELQRHLSQSQIFIDEYDFSIVSTYTQPPENYLSLLSNADLVISQNVKNIDYFKNSFISENLKKNALHISTEFWRFDGFWPVTSQNHRKNNWFWFPVDEFGLDLSFSDYMNYQVDDDLIDANFFSELNKFREIDQYSSIKIAPLFESIYKNERTFSDHWHPMPVFFLYICQEILRQLNISDKLKPMLANSINGNRYRLINNSIRNKLGLNFSDGRLIFLGRDISTEEYFNYAKHVQSKGFIDSPDFSMKDFSNEFNLFMDFKSASNC